MTIKEIFAYFMADSLKCLFASFSGGLDILRWLLSDKIDFVTTSLADVFEWLVKCFPHPLLPTTLFPISFFKELAFPSIISSLKFTHYSMN